MNIFTKNKTSFNLLKQNKIMKKILFIFSVAMGLTAFSFTVKNNLEKKPWPVPDANKNMRNPVASNAESIADGKTLYSTHCKSCHGTKGMGDGPKAAQLKTEAGDFSKADFQAQTDGAIFYKTSEGRDDMPKFKAKLPDADDRWSIVNYLRTLKK
jgi:mono/diheme cytochrome c family protein